MEYAIQNEHIDKVVHPLKCTAKKKTQVTKTKLDYKPAIGIYKSILQGNPIFGKISKIIKYVHKQLYDN